MWPKVTEEAGLGPAMKGLVMIQFYSMVESELRNSIIYAEDQILALKASWSILYKIKIQCISEAYEFKVFQCIRF